VAIKNEAGSPNIDIEIDENYSDDYDENE